MTNDDVFGWDEWERVLDAATAALEPYDDEDELPYLRLVEAISYGVGYRILREWARREWALSPLVHWWRWTDDGRLEWKLATADELRAELRRLRGHVARASAEPCPACGQPVKPGLKGRRYCSNACRQKAYRERRTRTARNENPLDPLADASSEFSARRNDYPLGGE